MHYEVRHLLGLAPANLIVWLACIKYRETYKPSLPWNFTEVPHTCDVGTVTDSDRGWQAVTASQDVECLVIHLGRVGKVHSLQDMGEDMVRDEGRALGSELSMPAHSL